MVRNEAGEHDEHRDAVEHSREVAYDEALCVVGQRDRIPLGCVHLRGSLHGHDECRYEEDCGDVHRGVRDDETFQARIVKLRIERSTDLSSITRSLSIYLS